MASPLSKTTQEHEEHRHHLLVSQMGGIDGLIPDMSNPSRASGERPLDTVRRISMLSEGRPAAESRSSRRSVVGPPSSQGKLRSVTDPGLLGPMEGICEYRHTQKVYTNRGG